MPVGYDPPAILLNPQKGFRARLRCARSVAAGQCEPLGQLVADRRRTPVAVVGNLPNTGLRAGVWQGFWIRKSEPDLPFAWPRRRRST